MLFFSDSSFFFYWKWICTCCIGLVLLWDIQLSKGKVCDPINQLSKGKVCDPINQLSKGKVWDPINQLSKGKVWDPINQFNPATFLCLTQMKTRIYNIIFHGLFLICSMIWNERDCLFCWYWWNCGPSLFKLSFHNWDHVAQSLVFLFSVL